jgi:hypothetical protein
MLQLWLMAQLQEDSKNIIFQQDRAPANFHSTPHRKMALVGLFVSQRTGSHSAGISCTTHGLFCP